MVPLVVGLGGQFALLPFPDQLTVPAQDGSPPPLAVLASLLTLLAIVGFVVVGPWLVTMVGRGIAQVSRTVPSLLAARRIADNPQATFYSVAAVGLAAVGLAYVACTVAVAPKPNTSGDRGPWNESLRPGVVAVMTGGVPRETVEPLLSEGVMTVGPRTRPACVDLARVLDVTCPYPPDSGFSEQPPDYQPTVVGTFYVPTDGSLAVSVVGVGIGILLAYGSTRQGAVGWRWPGADVYGLIGGGVLAALLFSAIALPLLNLTTRHDAVRFE